MEDTWSTRDLPVLDVIVRLTDEDPTGPDIIGADKIEPHVALGREDIHRAMWALNSGYFFEQFERGGGNPFVIGVTDRARQAVGAWPSPEAVLRRLLADLDEKIANAPDEETRGKWKRLREWLSSGGQQLLTGTLAQVLGNAGWSAIGS